LIENTLTYVLLTLLIITSTGKVVAKTLAP
jgi:hypothetical protein